jgi:type IV fimbrial biogenesis protein FimT
MKTRQIRAQKGFNLIELMFAILIMAITVNYATPAVQTFSEKNELKQAAERVYHFYRYARSEAIKQNSKLYVMYDGNSGSNWSFGLSKNQNCVPTDILTDAAPCKIDSSSGNNDGSTIETLKSVINGNPGSDYQGVSMSLLDSAGTAVTTLELELDPVRGSSTAGGIELATQNGWKLKNTISPLGEIQTCVPSGSPPIVGYRSCI